VSPARLATTELIVVVVITTETYVDLQKLVRGVIREIAMNTQVIA
jgi:S-adenosylmethionine synthetase